MDLWDFEDDLEAPDETPEPAQEPVRSVGKDIPAPRERQAPKSPREKSEPSVPKTPTGGEDRIRMNISKSRGRGGPSGAAAGQSKPESDFDELEGWEDAVQAPRPEPEFDELPVESTFDEPHVGGKVVPNLQPMPVDSPVDVERETAGKAEPVPELPAAESYDEFSPVARENTTPISLRPHLGLSRFERIGLIALAVLLVMVAGGIFVFSLNRLPTESKRAQANDFPIKGALLTISSASSYWRAPITEGPDADTFRRETQLLPVLEMAVSGGPAAIRVLFRNDDHVVVGDAVTRTVRSGGTVKIAATAGFDDIGMHAAYRTGESKPWTIEVFEAPSEETTGKDFKKLFEINISTDRR